MKGAEKKIACVVLLFTAILLPACSATSVRDGLLTNDPTNPFPVKILGHQVFLIFRSARQNLLGYTLRPGLEKAQVFGARFWLGKEKPHGGPGENRTIVFNRKQKRRVGAALPGIGFSNSYQGEVSFKLIFKGLRVKQLTVPVLAREYRDLPEARTSNFVVSVLAADEVLIQALVKEGGATRIGSRSDVSGVFSGELNYSESSRGVISARDSVIGYVVARPGARDLERRAAGPGLRRLGIFDLKDETGNADLAFLSSTMRHKLEEAFQSIPKFHVVTIGKKDAKYHLTGSYRKIGSRVQFELAMTNTYNQKLEHKVVRVVKADDVDKLYDYQISVVKDFARKFGVKLGGPENKRLDSVVRQAKDLGRLKEYQNAYGLLAAGRLQASARASRILTEKDTEYLDAWLLYSNGLIALSRFSQARSVVKHTVGLALESDNPGALARAYTFEGQVFAGLNDPASGLKSLLKGLEVMKRAYGSSHPDTLDYISSVAWARMLAARWTRNPRTRRAMYLKAEKEALHALNAKKSRFGPDDKRMISTYGTLANIQSKLRRKKAAITNAAASLRLAKKYYGTKHLFTARRLNELAIYYRYARRYDDSLALLLEAERVYRRALGRQVNLARGINYTSIGLIYYIKKDYKSALRYFLINVRAFEKMFGGVKNHANLAASYRRVGDTLLKMNDVRGAMKYWRRGRGLKSRGRRLARHLRIRYWRVAKDGAIPKGALRIGRDYNGKTLYACREEIGEEIFFGKIRPVYGACNCVGGGREFRAREYAVFVPEEKPRWVPGEQGGTMDAWMIVDVDLDLGPRKKRAPGEKPKQKGEYLYFCRVQYKGAAAVGMLRSGDTSTCRFGYGGVAYSSAKYEVLARPTEKVPAGMPKKSSVKP